MTRLPRILVAALVPLLVEVTVAQAEQPASGPRVRVTAPSFSGKRLVGNLVGLDATTLTLQRPGAKGSLQVPRATITIVEASRHRSRKAVGAGIGLLVGLGATAAVYMGAGDRCAGAPKDDLLPQLLCAVGTRGSAILSGILIVPAATLLGLVAAPGEKWEVSTTDRLRIAVAPTRGGGVRAALAIRF
jgi:hypothetical protein